MTTKPTILRESGIRAKEARAAAERAPAHTDAIVYNGVIYIVERVTRNGEPVTIVRKG